MFRLFFSFIFFAVVLLHPLSSFASHTSDPTVSLLQNRISKNFSKKFCNAIQNGLMGKEGIDYFKSYFLEIYDKTTPDKKLSS